MSLSVPLWLFSGPGVFTLDPNKHLSVVSQLLNILKMRNVLKLNLKRDQLKEGLNIQRSRLRFQQKHPF